MTKILSKFMIMLLIVLILLNACSNIMYAAVKVELDKALIQKMGYIEHHLKYYNEDNDEYEYLNAIFMGYEDNEGNMQPVYCINKELPGIETGEYYVTTENILDNNEIWRVIKNGYPFKNYKEYGLNDEKDLYAITRFAIYCVLGQQKLEYFKADKDDETAVKMLKVLKEIVNIGKNGKEEQNINPLSAKKVGGFVENNEYYMQQYKVEATTDLKKYKIVKKTGMPEGGYIADENGKKREEFSKNENFFVYIPKEQLNKNIDINIKINAECKVYMILEGKTTIKGKQNYAVTVGEKSTAETNVNFKQNVKNAKIVIYKMDNGIKGIIEGVEFELRDENGKIIDKKLTDKNGYAIFENLAQGKYTLKETKTKEEYILLDNEIEVQVEYNKTKGLTIYNTHKKRKFKDI